MEYGHKFSVSFPHINVPIWIWIDFGASLLQKWRECSDSIKYCNAFIALLFIWHSQFMLVLWHSCTLVVRSIESNTRFVIRNHVAVPQQQPARRREYHTDDEAPAVSFTNNRTRTSRCPLSECYTGPRQNRPHAPSLHFVVVQFTLASVF